MKKDRKKLKDTKLGIFLKDKAPDILDKVGDILPSNGALGIFKEVISKDDTLSAEDKERALQLINKEIEEQREVTKRWQSDNESGNKLAATARPITLHFVSLLILSYFVMGYCEIYVPAEYTSLLVVIVPTVYGGYFALREFGKHSKRKNK
jgi:hypothetical protein